MQARSFALLAFVRSMLPDAALLVKQSDAFTSAVEMTRWFIVRHHCEKTRCGGHCTVIVFCRSGSVATRSPRAMPMPKRAGRNFNIRRRIASPLPIRIRAETAKPADCERFPLIAALFRLSCRDPQRRTPAEAAGEARRADRRPVRSGGSDLREPLEQATRIHLRIEPAHTTPVRRRSKTAEP